MRLRQTPGDVAQIVSNLRERYAGSEAADDRQLLVVPFAALARGERNPRVRAAGKIESRRHDPRDDMRRSVEREDPSDNLAIAAKTGAPEPVRQHDVSLGVPGAILIATEHAPDLRAHAEHIAERGRDRHRPDPLRLPSGGQYPAAGHLAVGGNGLEGARLRPKVKVVRRGEGEAIAIARQLPYAHQPTGVAKGQRPQQHGFDDGEHGGRAADAQAKRDDGERGDQRPPEQRAAGEAKVLQHRTQHFIAGASRASMGKPQRTLMLGAEVRQLPGGIVVRNRTGCFPVPGPSPEGNAPS